ncbi:MAG TPA: DNA polymerase domain-containing protein [Chthoniobacteraceae bacterium]|jgi:DNA polymerase elongation subunit (family B)|nr:DNA polymerase domain-containing protein [Chthoniobacteraceae bacterium]
MAFEDNALLFGHDPEPGIVAAEYDGAATVTLYSRQGDGKTVAREESLRPFLWSVGALPPDAAQGAEVVQLEGGLAYDHLTLFENWGGLTRAKAALKTAAQPSFSLGDPIQQYLLATGKTLFKKLEWSDVRRMQIAVDSREIHLADSTGWAESLGRSELERLTALIQERDPDVIEGHDLFKKILPGLAAHARNAKVKLLWGRDGTALASRASRIQVAEKTITYPKYEAAGRHFVDTWLLAQFYDVTARALESFDLADVAAHLHIPEGPAVRQVAALSEALGASYFAQAKIFPYNYQDVIVRGSATKADSLFLREYLRRRHSLPDLPEPRPFEGGYTDIFFTGVARNVWHCDVASLYPSLMLQFGIFPATDRLGIFRGILADLRAYRLEAKQEMRAAAAPATRASLKALQTTFKILINAMYGYLGFAQARFADYDAAADVTARGRALLRAMVARLQELGAKVIEIDTDGIYFTPPEKADIAKLHASLAEILPPGIDVEFDEQYDAMFSYKAKNYALLDNEGELTLRGGAFRSRGLERFQRQFMEETILLLMRERSGEVEALRAEYEGKIRGRAWPIEWLAKTDTLQDSLGQYSKKIEGSSRNRAAAYELALKSGRKYEPGDQVSYYITGAKKNVPAYENARLISEWDPENRDENVEYYAAKLQDLAKKFAPFIEAPAPAQSSFGF